MTCREARQFLDDYLDNDLDSKLAPQLKDHLDRCENCRVEFEEKRTLKEVLSASRPPEPDAGYWPELSSLILAKTTDHEAAPAYPARPRTKPEDRRDFMRSSLALAASICILLGALYLGSQKAYQARQLNPPGAPVFVTANLEGLVGGTPDAILTKREFTNIVLGRMLIGSPGPGKAMGLIDLLTF